MKRFGSAILILMLCVIAFALPAMAQTKVSDAQTCTQLAILDAATATTKVISAVAATNTTIMVNGAATTTAIHSKHIRICNVTYRVKQTTGAADFGLTTGTGTNCGTGTANFTPQWSGTASVTETLALSYGADGALVVPSGKDLCFALSATPTKAQILVSYAIY